MPLKICVDDIINKTFGKLKVIEYLSDKSGPKKHWYKVLCECGQTKEIKRDRLLRKVENTTSCGNCIYGTLVGKKISRLLVLEDLGLKGRRGKSRFVKVQCDCGTVKEVAASSLLYGHKIKSCGCLLKEFNSRLPPYEAAYNAFYYHTSMGASQRELSFTIDKDFFKWLTQQDCFYCGALPSKIYKYNKGKVKLLYNGIDRIDSSLGYIKDNCITCCYGCNIAKGLKTQSEFLELIKQIYNKHFG